MTRNIFQNGTAHVVSLTKELRELGLEKGDEVQVTVIDDMLIITDTDVDTDNLESSINAVNSIRQLGD